MYLPNLKSVALPVSEIIAIKFLHGGCKPPILGKGRPYGVGMVQFERALVGSYIGPIVTFPLSFTHFRDITAFVLQCIIFSHPTSSLPKISPSSHGRRLGYEERRC